MSHSSLFYPCEGKGQSAPGRTQGDLQKNFLPVDEGEGRWRHLRRKGQGPGRRQTKGSARSWTPTFSSEVPLQQEELKLDSMRDILIGVKGP